jgi:uncharacterized protein (TIGR00297 family)
MLTEVFALGAPTLPPSSRVWTSLLVTLAFTALARVLQGVSKSGALAGAIVCFSLYAGAGAGAFGALVSVFVLAWITTRTGYRRKENLGTAERTGGRTASQVLANLGVAAGFASLYALSGKTICLFAIAAALSEAAADTVSSEIGQIGKERVRLITTWREVPAGTDGGVTLLGTVAGIGAAIIVSAVSVLGGMVPWNRIWIPIFAAFAGTIADSLLGALFERRKLLNNDLVNLLGTLVAALVVFLMS